MNKTFRTWFIFCTWKLSGWYLLFQSTSGHLQGRSKVYSFSKKQTRVVHTSNNTKLKEWRDKHKLNGNLLPCCTKWLQRRAECRLASKDRSTQVASQSTLCLSQFSQLSNTKPVYTYIHITIYKAIQEIRISRKHERESGMGVTDLKGGCPDLEKPKDWEKKLEYIVFFFFFFCVWRCKCGAQVSIKNTC